MTKKWTEEEISKELQRISASIPAILQKHVMEEKLKTPTVEFVAKKLLEDPDISEEKKAAVKVLLETGDFSQTKLVEDKENIKKLDNFLGREINKSIKSGRLPPRSQIKNLPWFKKRSS